MSDTERVLCRRCGRPIVANQAQCSAIFEHMHWSCFHLEYEHPGDPDQRCEDPGCPVWVQEVYEAKLRELGAEPKDVLGEAVRKRWGSS